MGFLGGLIRAGVAGGAGALKGANAAEQTRYERGQDQVQNDRLAQQQALQALLLQERMKPPTPFDPNTDPALLREKALRDQGLGGYSVKPQAELIPEWKKQGYPDWATWRRDQITGKVDPNPQQTPAPGKPPMAAVDAVTSNRGTLRVIDEALAALEKNPGAVGPSLYNYAPEWVKKPFNTEERTAVQAPIADIASQTVKLRSGATVTIGEEPRLAPFIPDVRDKPEVVRFKLQRLKTLLGELTTEVAGAYGFGDDQGMVQRGAAAMPPAGIARPSGTSGNVTPEERAALKAKGYSDQEIDAL